MRVQAAALTAFFAAVVLLAGSCARRSETAVSVKSSAKGSFEISQPVSSTEMFAAQNASAATSIDIEKEAAKEGSTPGRVALAAVINKLDGTSSVDDLSKKSAQELFDILQQTASQKSQTLESLDQLYYLTDILADEKIFVNFQSNNVVSSMAEDSVQNDWIPKFEKAISSVK